jgi:hypothetical protein
MPYSFFLHGAGPDVEFPQAILTKLAVKSFGAVPNRLWASY